MSGSQGIVLNELPVFFDSQGQNPNWQQVITQNKFESEKLNKNTVYRGFDKHTIWLLLDLDKIKGANYIQINNAHLDYISLYKIGKLNRVDSIITGDRTPFASREFEVNMFQFSIDTNYRQYLFKISTEGMLSVPFSFFTQEDILLGKHRPAMFYFGFVLLAVLFNFFLIFWLKDKIYLYYFGSIFIVGLVIVLDWGLFFQFLWPNSPELNHYVVIPYSSIIILALFSEKFLELETSNRLLYRMYQIIYLVALFVVLLGVMGKYNFGIQIISVISLVIPLLNFISGAIIYGKKRTRFIFLFSLAFLFYSFFNLLYYLSFLDVVNTNYIVKNSVQMANISEILFLFMAVVDRFKHIETEQIVMQQKMLEVVEKNKAMLQEQNQLLERGVTERTHEIEILNHNLSKANSELLTANKDFERTNETLTEQKEELKSTLNRLQETQEQLVQSEKMAALGVLTAGIAHEINNPLNYANTTVQAMEPVWKDILELESEYKKLTFGNVSGQIEYITSLREKKGYEQSLNLLPNALQSLKMGLQRIIEISNGLRLFSRMDQSMREIADLNQLIEAVLVILSAKSKGKVKIIAQCGELPLISCYPGKLQQVLLNLIDNALDSILFNQEITEMRQIEISSYISKNTIVIQIADTGMGIHESIKDKVFDPFFTTKDVGKGTGLGLSISMSIIEEHNGTIEFERNNWGGTTFFLTIPIN